jgi:hypothetical protein
MIRMSFAVPATQPRRRCAHYIMRYWLSKVKYNCRVGFDVFEGNIGVIDKSSRLMNKLHCYRSFFISEVITDEGDLAAV